MEMRKNILKRDSLNLDLLTDLLNNAYKTIINTLERPGRNSRPRIGQAR